MSICTSVWQPQSQRGIARVTTCVKAIWIVIKTRPYFVASLSLRELLGDEIHTYDRHMIDISQNGKWVIPEWKVVYTRMESGICQNGN